MKFATEVAPRLLVERVRISPLTRIDSERMETEEIDSAKSKMKRSRYVNPLRWYLKRAGGVIRHRLVEAMVVRYRRRRYESTVAKSKSKRLDD
jgi:hypothetical protein